MKILDKMERKFGRFGIPNLMLYLVIGNLLVYIFDIFFVLKAGTTFSQYLYFSPALVMQGQIWRIITFVFVPPNSSLVFIAFTLYFYYFIGVSLEREWGSFRFTIYYLTGMVATIIGGFISYFLPVGGGISDIMAVLSMSTISATYLNLSLFFAFATLYPDHKLLLFFFIPIKVKYLAFADAVIFLYSLIVYPWTVKISIIMAILNYLLFFGPDFIRTLKLKAQVRKNRKNFQQKMDNTWNR